MGQLLAVHSGVRYVSTWAHALFADTRNGMFALLSSRVGTYRVNNYGILVFQLFGVRTDGGNCMDQEKVR